ncbi:MAG: thioredoxin-like protein [Monoraphidium minutum]|nr:MAG: thioredoxin-like protein [Monoraphidium minutum]
MAPTAVMGLALVLVLISASQQAAAQQAARAEFRSCAGCMLNSLPEVKRFLKQEVEAGSWERVSVTWQPGAPPELFVFDGEGNEAERLSVRGESFEGLAALLESKGFSRSESGGDEAEGDAEGDLEARGRELRALRGDPPNPDAGGDATRGADTPLGHRRRRRRAQPLVDGAPPTPDGAAAGPGSDLAARQRPRRMRRRRVAPKGGAGDAY